MRQALLPSLVAMGVLVPAVALVWTVPALRSPQAQVNAEVAQSVERARRLLHRYNENQDRLAALVEELAALDHPVDLDDDTLESLVERDQQFLESKYEETWEQHLGTRPARFGPNTQQMASRIRQGQDARRALLQENADLLRQAMAAVDEALQIRRGSASGSDSVIAHQLRAIIRMQQGAAAARRAIEKRQRAARLRDSLGVWGARATRLMRERHLVDASNIEARIHGLAEQVARRETELDAIRRAVQTLEVTIADLGQRVADLRARAREARAVQEAMEDRGVDLAAAESIDDFAERYNHHARTYRRAVREADMLEFGTLSNAQIDASQDFLNGTYVAVEGQAIVRVRGLTSYREEHDRRSLEMEGHQRLLQQLVEDRAALEALAARLRHNAERSTAALDDVRRDAADLAARWDETVADAEETEDRALDLFESAGRALRQAAGAARNRAADASQAIMSLDSRSRDRASQSVIADDTKVGGQIGVQTAEAHLRMGRVYYRRFRALQQDQAVLQDVIDSLALTDVDLEELAERAAESRDAATGLLQDAMEALQRSERDLQQHWTIPAEAGAVLDLLARFGYQGLRDTAIANYAAAVESREDNEMVRVLVDRLQQLRSQTGDPTPPAAE